MEGITALQKLARLRLQNILTAPLTDAVSALTKLTSIALCSENYTVFGGEIRPSFLPGAAGLLANVRHLDTDGFYLPPALAGLTGMHTLTTSTLYAC